MKTFTHCHRRGNGEKNLMTISDIAKMAGVSSAAVSRYLNGGPLSEQKRAVIQAVVEKTGYSPDTAAQTLRTGKVRQVGVPLRWQCVNVFMPIREDRRRHCVRVGRKPLPDADG